MVSLMARGIENGQDQSLDVLYESSQAPTPENQSNS